MAKYIVSYDLKKPEKDYPDLIAYLKRIGGIRPLLSVWFVKSANGSEDLRNAIQKNGNMDGNDRLLVAGLDGSAAWVNLLIDNKTVKEWFESA